MLQDIQIHFEVLIEEKEYFIKKKKLSLKYIKYLDVILYIIVKNIHTIIMNSSLE